MIPQFDQDSNFLTVYEPLEALCDLSDRKRCEEITLLGGHFSEEGKTYVAPWDTHTVDHDEDSAPLVWFLLFRDEDRAIYADFCETHYGRLLSEALEEFQKRLEVLRHYDLMKPLCSEGEKLLAKLKTYDTASCLSLKFDMSEDIYREISRRNPFASETQGDYICQEATEDDHTAASVEELILILRASLIAGEPFEVEDLQAIANHVANELTAFGTGLRKYLARLGKGAKHTGKEEIENE